MLCAPMDYSHNVSLDNLFPTSGELKLISNRYSDEIQIYIPVARLTGKQSIWKTHFSL
jgi:hypothetical protein